METFRKELLTPNEKQATTGPIKLPRHTLDQLRKATDGGTRNFHKGYAIISKYLGSSLGTDDLRYWFRKAIEINRNDKSSIANEHIRGANEAAAKIDGRQMTPQLQQKLSNLIGGAVFEKILKNGHIPKLQTIINTDVILTLRGMPGAKEDDVSNWAGAYRYWDMKITLGNETKTVGAFITANKKSHDKFIAVQAGGAARVVRSEAADRFSEKAEIIKEIFNPTRGPSAIDRGRILKRTDESFSDPKSDLHLDKDEGASLKEPKARPEPNLSVQNAAKELEPQPDEDALVPSVRPQVRAPKRDLFENFPGINDTKNRPALAGLNREELPEITPKSSFIQDPFPRKISHAQQLPKPLDAGGGAFGTRRGAALDDGKIISAVKSPDIAKLDAPTEEMVRQNVFKPDASGKTNLTEEAKIWKKNKRVAFELIKQAGRWDEFLPFLTAEDLG